MPLRVLHDLLDLPLHRIERMVRAVEHALGTRPGDRLAEKRQPADARAVHVDVIVLLGDLDDLPHAFDEPRVAEDHLELGKIARDLAETRGARVLAEPAVNENGEIVVLRRFHQRIDFLPVVGRTVLDQRVDLDAFEPELHALFQNLQRVLGPHARAQAHEAVNAPGMFSHRVGDVLIRFAIVRRLADADRESDHAVDAGVVHRAQHVLSHPLHDRRNLVDRELLARAHVRVRVDDFDLFSFDGYHFASGRFSERSESNIAGQHEVQYTDRMTLILNNDEIQQALTIKNSLDALEETYRELAQSGAVNCPISQTYLPHSLPQTSYSFTSVNGGVKTLGVLALRITSDILGERKVGESIRLEKLPLAGGNRYVGLVQLYSIETGELLAIMPDGFIQQTRVGVTSALGAKAMAREDSETMALIGSGGQARSHFRFMTAVRPIKRVKIYSPNPENRKRFAAEMERENEIPTEPVESAETA